MTVLPPESSNSKGTLSGIDLLVAFRDEFQGDRCELAKLLGYSKGRLSALINRRAPISEKLDREICALVNRKRNEMKARANPERATTLTIRLGVEMEVSVPVFGPEDRAQAALDAALALRAARAASFAKDSITVVDGSSLP